MLDEIIRSAGSHLPRPIRKRARRLYRYIDQNRRAEKSYDSRTFFNSQYSAGEYVTDDVTVSIRNEYDLQTPYHYNLVENALLSELIRMDRDPRGCSVLDIGSGAGHWIDFWLDREVQSVTGVEIADEAVESLEDRYERTNGVTIKHADIVADDLSLGEYDIVNAIGVMFHIVDADRWEQAVRNLCGVLRSDGIGFVGGRFGIVSRNVQFHNNDSFTSYEERIDDGEGDLLVNKRLRSRWKWKRTIREYGGQPVRVINTPVPNFITTPENNVLVFEK